MSQFLKKFLSKSKPTFLHYYPNVREDNSRFVVTEDNKLFSRKSISGSRFIDKVGTIAISSDLSHEVNNVKDFDEISTSKVFDLNPVHVVYGIQVAQVFTDVKGNPVYLVKSIPKKDQNRIKKALLKLEYSHNIVFYDPKSKEKDLHILSAIDSGKLLAESHLSKKDYSDHDFNQDFKNALEQHSKSNTVEDFCHGYSSTLFDKIKKDASKEEYIGNLFSNLYKVKKDSNL